ncbi:MAG TPA: YeeE/YedE family protein [Rhizobiales bacterium]|nr:putative inner membrane protein [bacterium BMS3Bbin10]HDO51194.1 YeeE/YedE family protein [Hyphomicrobiales bacterium]
MAELTTGQLVALSGLVLGVIVGWVARWARFCTFGAVEDMVLTGNLRRLKSWALAIAVAMLGVQLMHVMGIARIDETFYLGPNFHWAGAIVGGFLFGLGMALVGTCGFGTLVRMGGGDLKAVVTFLVMGLTAYMTAGGITGYARRFVLDAVDIDLTNIGGQGLPHLAAALFGMDAQDLWMPMALVFAGLLLAWCFSGDGLKGNPRDLIAGLVIGLAVAGGFAATGILGNDPFETAPVRSLSYVTPPGRAIIYLVTFVGATINFSIALVFGTIAGSFAAALWNAELRMEAYDDAREMRRHLLGAFMMGFGGVVAYGCTIGQGISGMATLSAAAPLALGSILIGATGGLYYLLTGSLKDAFDLTFRRIWQRA